MFAFFVLLLPYDTADLAAPDWHAREVASARLRAAGWLALPAVLDGCESPDPEVRARCRALADHALNLSGRLSAPAYRAAEALLTSPGWCTPADAIRWADPILHSILDDAAHRLGLIPEAYTGPWGYPMTEADKVFALVNYCRSQRTRDPWPWARPWQACVRP